MTRARIQNQIKSHTHTYPSKFDKHFWVQEIVRVALGDAGTDPDHQYEGKAHSVQQQCEHCNSNKYVVCGGPTLKVFVCRENPHIGFALEVSAIYNLQHTHTHTNTHSNTLAPTHHRPATNTHLYFSFLPFCLVQDKPVFCLFLSLTLCQYPSPSLSLSFSRSLT